LLIEERHRKVAKIEKPSVDTIALLQVLKNPLRWLFRETTLAGASDYYGNDGHAFNPCCSPNSPTQVRASGVAVRTRAESFRLSPTKWRLAVYSIRLYYSDRLFGKDDECAGRNWEK
jgi:hypothetical protein